LRFIDLFAGLGGFHLALTGLGHECVFASEIDEELRGLYAHNFPSIKKRIVGDIRDQKQRVPAHDILCAGFPCQPFSKSGYQHGRRDRTRGTLFHEILEVVRHRKPTYLILENVGNFERHNNGRTWKIVKESLETLGYHVRGTTHIATGGPGLISPHHLGYPHHRERFFIVGSRNGLPEESFPKLDRHRRTSLSEIVQKRVELSSQDLEETSLTAQQIDCVDHWNTLLSRIPESLELPSFPIWGEEIGASYPYNGETPFSVGPKALAAHVKRNGVPLPKDLESLLQYLPSYARTHELEFPKWKERFITQNRDWFAEIHRHLGAKWVVKLGRFPSSLRKLEWNCQGEERDLWKHVLQFRPSGLRVKRYSSVPALVAMTTTQIPILGPKRRFISRTEGLRLQGFPDTHRLPETRVRAFAALGNAVHVKVAQKVASLLVRR
jgi:DNA (cytosine-5)-methyltransferase 1